MKKILLKKVLVKKIKNYLCSKVIFKVYKKLIYVYIYIYIYIDR